MLNQGPNYRQLAGLYRRLRALDDTLPEQLSASNPLRGFVNAIYKIKEAQLKELDELRTTHFDVVLRHLQLNHAVNYATQVDTLIALDRTIDDINNEIICTQIDPNQTSLNLSNCGITRLPASLFTMPGFVNFFRNLEELNCNHNAIRVLSLRNLPALRIIDCDDTNVERLDLHNLPELADISMINGCLSGCLDLRAFPKLYAIALHNNQIEAIDVRGLQFLLNFDCSNNNLTELDVDSPVITNLNCSWNHLVRLHIANTDHLKLPKVEDQEEAPEEESEQEDLGTFLNNLLRSPSNENNSDDQASSDIGGLHLYVNALPEIPRNLVDKFGEEWAAEEMAEQVNLGIRQQLLRNDAQVPVAHIPAAAQVPAPIPAAATLPQFQLHTGVRTRSQAARDSSCGQDEQLNKKQRHK
ncbi:MAG: hypothetical protein AB7I18_13360 [Candidatus Berkiella sp.]